MLQFPFYFHLLTVTFFDYLERLQANFEFIQKVYVMKLIKGVMTTVSCVAMSELIW